jgi:imidazolonepropionase-like amidohydrolase
MVIRRSNADPVRESDHRPRVRLVLLKAGVAAVAAAFLPVAAALAEETPALVIEGARLIDGTGAPAREGVTVIVEGERIAAVGGAGRVRAPAGARVVDAAGKTLLPGLIDTHVHFRDYVAELFLAHGVTTVRDAGNPTEWILELRRLQAAGEMPGPRIFAVGNIIDAPPPMRGHHIGVETPAEARAAARRLIEAGVDAIKVYVKMTPELLRPVVETAHAANRRVIGHVTMSARDAALAGIDALEHGSGIALAIARDPALVQAIPEHHGVFGWRFMDAAKADELVRLLVDRRVAVVPALVSWARGAPQRPALRAEAAAVVTHPELAYLPGFVMERINRLSADQYSQAERRDLEADYYALKDFLGRFRRAGGTVVVGTDGGGLLGLSVHHELQLLVDMGFSPLEAIRAATGAAAELIQADELGTVAPGKIADLVLVDGNPLTSIEDTKKIVMVIQRGRIIDASFHRDYRIPIPRPPVRGSRP